MYSVVNQKAYINGEKGIYDGKVQNDSVRYGRNSVDNNKKYLEDYTIKSKAQWPDLKGLSKSSAEEAQQKLGKLDAAIDENDKWLNSLPPLEFEQRYMPKNNGKPDKMALMGAAYEEMGKRTEMDTKELTSTLQEAFGDKVSAEALDLNHDAKIDLAEYSTSILLSDILSTDSSAPSIKGVTGTINNEGQDASLAYASKKNYDIAARTYRAIYQTYDLGKAQQEFKQNPNNLAS